MVWPQPDFHIGVGAAAKFGCQIKGRNTGSHFFGTYKPHDQCKHCTHYMDNVCNVNIKLAMIVIPITRVVSAVVIRQGLLKAAQG